MVLTARMGFIPRAGTTPAFMDFSWHASVSSPSERMPALYAIRPLDRKPPNPEVVFLHALSLILDGHSETIQTVLRAFPRGVLTDDGDLALAHAIQDVVHGRLD